MQAGDFLAEKSIFPSIPAECPISRPFFRPAFREHGEPPARQAMTAGTFKSQNGSRRRRT